MQVVCAADVPLLVERFTRRARSGERHPGHADASALDELIPRIANEQWDALTWMVLSFMWTRPGILPTCISSYATSETSSTNTQRIS